MTAFVATSLAGALLAALGAAPPEAEGEGGAKGALPSPMGIEARFGALLRQVGQQ